MRTTRFRTRLNGELDFTGLGLGGAPLGNLYRAIPEAEAERTIRTAWDRGIRHFDTAPFYGHGLSELRMGRVLRDYPRDDYLLSTKIGRLLEPCAPGEEGAGQFVDPAPFRCRYDYSYDGVMRSYADSLERLGTERIDILYIHDVDVFTHGSQAEAERRIDEVMAGGYRALEELRRAGDVKAIGAGVNEWQICEALAGRGDFDLFLLAGRYTLLEQEALDSFLPLCETRGIGIVIGGPYNSGVLASGAVAGAMYNYTPAPEAVLERVRAIEAICRAQAVPLAAAALAFPLAHPAVVSVIPGGQSAEQVAQNVDTLNQPIDPALWAALRQAGLLRPDAPVPA